MQNSFPKEKEACHENFPFFSRPARCLRRQVTESFQYPQAGGGTKTITSDFSLDESTKDPAFRRKVVFPGFPGGEHFEFAFAQDKRGYIRQIRIQEHGSGGFRNFAEYGYEGSYVSARKVHPEKGENSPTIDVTWTRDQLGRLTSIQTNQTFQETLNWTTREELKAIEYPHIYHDDQNGGAFEEKWDWYQRNSFSLLSQAKYGVPNDSYTPGGFSGAPYEKYLVLTQDLVGNWSKKNEYEGGVL